jgi:predicted enzyme related to lactoylglutathione lyase
MKRVTGIGGIFFKTGDSTRLKEWYSKHLGIVTDQYGATFSWKDAEGKTGHTVWSLFKKDTEYFKPGDQEYMINYRVENLEELLKILKEEGVQIVGEMETFEYGKFGWIMDPDGHKIELWEPNNDEFEKILESVNPSS